MIYRFWPWALLLSGLFLLPVLLIHAQIYDDGGLRAFLTPPEDCPAPCFMGIRPGVTTVEEAASILDEHPWVVPGTLTLSSIEYSGGDRYAWQWAETVPTWLSPEVDSAIIVERGLVSKVEIRPLIRWSDVLLALGWPDRYQMMSVYDNTEMSPFEYMHFGWYEDWKLLVVAGGYCWDRPMYEWHADLYFQADSREFSLSSYPTMLTCRL